jgi:hypothetical protein
MKKANEIIFKQLLRALLLTLKPVRMKRKDYVWHLERQNVIGFNPDGVPRSRKRPACGRMQDNQHSFNHNICRFL